jgi:hypothetical protein
MSRFDHPAGDEIVRLQAEIERLRVERAELLAALLPCVGWLEYAYRNIDSATATAVKMHLPTIRAALARVEP